MKKKVVCVLLTALLLINTFGCAELSAYSYTLNESGKCGNNVSYTYDKTTKKVVISGSGPMKNYSDDSNSTKSPFSNNEIKSIVIEDGVTTVGDYAFSGCTSANSVIISDSVTSIGNYAFVTCLSLYNAVISANLTKIGDYAFSRSGLKNIDIPNKVEIIGNGAFDSCREATSLSIGNSVVSIGDKAFYDCGKLSNLILPDSVKTIGEYCFCYTNISNVKIGKNLTKIGGHAFRYTPITAVVIPDSVKIIGPFAFFQSSLKNVTIGNGVTELQEAAFAECYSLTDVKIGTKVNIIGARAFSMCKKISEIIIPQSVTTIGRNAFYGCEELEYFSIPKTVTSIGEGAFKNTIRHDDKDNWEGDSLYFDNHLIEVNKDFSGEYKVKDNTICVAGEAFYQCSNLKSVILPSGLINIGKAAFSQCTNLTKIYIPKSLKKVELGAFANCYKLADVYYFGTKNDWQKIEIEKNANIIERLNSANIHYNYVVPCSVHGATKVVKENNKNATCAKPGSYDSVVYCSICNTEISRSKKTIKATGKHTYDKGKVTVKPTSSKFGTLAQTCTVCKATKKTKIAKLATVSISSIASQNKGFKIGWKKVSSSTGYQIQYSTKSNFSGAKTTTVTKNSVTSKTVTGLSVKKKYYVRIRTYRTINGTKYYSSWSKSKAITTK